MPDVTSPETFNGEVVYLYAIDVAYELRRPVPQTLLGQPLVSQKVVGPSKRSPRQLLFQHLHTARLESISMKTPGGVVEVQRIVKVLPVGAVSIMLRVPFASVRIEALGAFQEPDFAQEVIHQHLLELSGRIHAELAPFSIRPATSLPEGEAYTVFCLSTPTPTPLDSGTDALFYTEPWFQTHRRAIAGILTQEDDGSLLSQQEADESTGAFLSYYRTDLVVVDWDAALIIDEQDDVEESLHVLELANLQLEELIAYDRLLDSALDRSYADLLHPPKFFSRKNLLQRLREVRIDLARFSDEISNITKFFGDWHRAIDDKLKTLDDLYEMLKQEQDHRLMVVLEASIVVMFLVDIAMLLYGIAK